jgi:hypothetical protein
MTPEFYDILQNGFIVVFYVLMLCFVLFSIATIYHWFSFGSSRSISLISMAVYLIVAAPLFLLMSLFLSFM